MNEKRDHIFILVYHISFVAHRKNQLYPVFSEVSVTQLTFLRSFHNLGAAAWKDRSPSVVSVLPLQGVRSKPSLERKSYLPVSLTEISSLM